MPLRFSSQLVIDAGAGHVAAARFRAGPGGRLVLEAFQTEPRGPEPARDPEWVAEVTGACERAAGTEGLHGAASWAVAGHLTLTKCIHAPAVPPGRRDQVIRFEAEQNLPFPLETLAWDHAVITDGTDGTEVLLTAAKVEVMERLCVAAEGAGVPVRRAVATCVALHRAFRHNYPARVAPALVVDVGARTTNVLVAGPGGSFLARTVRLGGVAITAALADELKVDFAAAEQRKLALLGAGAGRAGETRAKAALERAVADFAGELQREIVRTTGSFGWRTGSTAPARLYLTGGGSLVPGLESGLANGLGLPVERYDPLRNVALAEPVRRVAAGDASRALVNLVGLAALGFSPPAGDVGLLPPGLRAAREGRRRQRAMLTAAALLVAAPLPAAGYWHRSADRERREAAAIAAQLPPLRAQAQRNRALLAELATVQERIAATRRVLAARTGWTEFLGDLEERLGRVGDAWLEELSLVQPAGPAGPDLPGLKPAAGRPLQLRLAGCLLDLDPPAAAGGSARARVEALLASLAASPFVAALGEERFNGTQRGTLRFAFTLTLNPARPL